MDGWREQGCRIHVRLLKNGLGLLFLGFFERSLGVLEGLVFGTGNFKVTDHGQQRVSCYPGGCMDHLQEASTRVYHPAVL